MWSIFKVSIEFVANIAYVVSALALLVMRHVRYYFPAPPTLEGGVSTMGPPGKSLCPVLKAVFLSFSSSCRASATPKVLAKYHISRKSI